MAVDEKNWDAMQGKSDENWDVGNNCLHNNQINAAASSIYYAVYQAVISLYRKETLLKPDTDNNKGAGKHRKMVMFVRNHGKAGNYFSNIYASLLDLRTTADYDGREAPDKDELESLLSDANKIREFYFREASL